ncbi:MAG: UvrD-helicase domain-containing protein [Methyloprofundus sp.]|nr:UvrD-helicase domain-containing protein [Methyloprofundus sp.]
MASKLSKIISYRTSWIAQLLARHTDYLAFNTYHDRIVFKGDENPIPLLAIVSEISVEQGIFWNSLSIHLNDGQKIRLGGIGKKQATALQTSLNQAAQYHMATFYQGLTPDIERAYLQAQSLFQAKRYIRYPLAQQWLKSHQHLALGLKRQDVANYVEPEVLTALQAIQPLLNHGYAYIEQWNEAYVQQQLTEFQAFFDQVESHPLTEKQRRACVIDEQHNLVLAGAGTGKTSTMIGRAGYLLQSEIARPQEILMLAFARQAADEMEQRIQAKLGVSDLTVKTFHSLGKHIISQVEGVVPSISKMAEDEHLRARFVDAQIQRLLSDEQYKSRLVTYFLRFSYPYKSAFRFKSLGEYNQYILDNDMRTLQGELVKSYEECEIANFLYRQGVRYQYEANYQINTSGPDYKAYQPDFFLPDYGLYIEHFAVNEHNQTPPFIDQQSYLEGMAWKRALHEKHQTQLIATYSYQKHQGILTQSLREQLQQAGVSFQPLANNELLKQLNQLGQVSAFGQLLAQVLALFKAAYLNIKDMSALAGQHEDKERMQAAAFLFEPIYELYQQHLRDTQTIDFEDMIGLAIGYVESLQYQSPYRYLLVDEFQDISASRARLIKALLNQQAENSLFCVGDDWQSIYRFTGSDVTITKEFSKHFGYSAISILDKTFRFNNKISEFAGQFVMRNSTQIAKQMHSQQQINQSAVSLIKTNQDSVGLNAALSAIDAKSHNKTSSVLVLARNSFKKPDLSIYKSQYPNLQLQFMTVHASKGKEADYVIILGLDKGKHGFPAEKATPALLDLLLPEAEDFAYAEERRLFYVALTRARHHVYLISDATKASDFIRELIYDQYDMHSDEFHGAGFQDKLADQPCSQCQAGFMLAKDSQYGSFFACNQYPLCAHTESACQWCGGELKEQGRFKVCVSKRCDYIEPVCPKCAGSMRLRKGPYGQFWACANYRKGAEFSCQHKEKQIDLSAYS